MSATLYIFDLFDRYVFDRDVFDSRYITLREERKREKEDRTSLTIPRDLILHERLRKMEEHIAHNNIWPLGAEYNIVTYIIIPRM